MEWPANYTFFSANVCMVFICEPPLTKHDPGFNFIDRKKKLGYTRLCRLGIHRYLASSHSEHETRILFIKSTYFAVH